MAAIEPVIDADKKNDVKFTCCHICKGTLRNAKLLPCFHSFCLKCLTKEYKVNKPGEEVSCTTCQDKFQIPVGGLAMLQHNFVVDSLLKSPALSDEQISKCSPGSSVCEVCSAENDNPSTSIPLATMYCIECRQKLCESCCKPHRRMPSQPHQVVTLGIACIGKGASISKISGNVCIQHPTQPLDTYCQNCKTVICVTCHSASRKHECVLITEILNTLVKQLDADLNSVSCLSASVRKDIKKLSGEKARVLGEIAKADSSIRQQADKVKKLVDECVEMFSQKLDSFKSSTLMSIDSDTSQANLALAALERFQMFAQLVKDHGVPCDIAHLAAYLHEKADGIVKKVHNRTVAYHPIDLRFIPTDLQNTLNTLTATSSNLLGKISFADYSAELVGMLPEGDPVQGVTILDNELYVVRRGTSNIEIYDTKGFTLQRCQPVPSLGYPKDMASSNQYQCVYIADHKNKSVHRVERQGAMVQWPVTDKPFNLSVTSAENVLVSCSDKNKLKEFTTLGFLVREICLQPDIISPFHAVELASGQIVVCHGRPSDNIHRVCVVDDNGQMLLKYGNKKGCSGGQLSLPFHIVVSDTDFIMIGDCNNSRVVLLSRSLVLIRLVLSRSHGLRHPAKLFLEHEKRRLYVADNEMQDDKLISGRVMVFDL